MATKPPSFLDHLNLHQKISLISLIIVALSLFIGIWARNLILTSQSKAFFRRCLSSCPPATYQQADCSCASLPRAVPTVCSPRPPCLDTPPYCKIKEPIGGWCSPSVSPTPDTEPRFTPNPTQTINRAQILCTQSGGTWKYFGSSCADNCDTNPLQGRMCATIVTQSCDCGPNQCWSGARCLDNP